MKSYYLITLLLPFLSFSQFTIKGKILDSKNIDDLEINAEINAYAQKIFPAKITEDSFIISGEITEPSNTMLVIKNKGEQSSIKLMLDRSSSYEISLLLENDPSVLGGEWFEIKTESDYYNTWRNFYDDQKVLSQSKQKLMDDFEKKLISKKELDVSSLKIDDKINNAFKNLALQKPKSFATPYILTGAPDLSSEYKSYYQNLSADVKNSYWGKILNKTLAKFDSAQSEPKKYLPILGARTKSINGQTLSGTSKSYSSNNFKSKLTLIDFWASWCVPCRKENKRLKKINTHFDNNDLTIISFSLDDSLKNWKEASIKDDISWENISDLKGSTSMTMMDFQIIQLPRNVLIDSKGTIIAMDKFEDDLESFITQYLKSL